MRGENGERERALLTQRNQSPDLCKKTRSICTSPSCTHATRPYTLASLERRTLPPAAHLPCSARGQTAAQHRAPTAQGPVSKRRLGTQPGALPEFGNTPIRCRADTQRSPSHRVPQPGGRLSTASCLPACPSSGLPGTSPLP